MGVIFCAVAALGFQLFVWLLLAGMSTPTDARVDCTVPACVRFTALRRKQFGPAQILLGLKQKKAGTWQRCSMNESGRARRAGAAECVDRDDDHGTLPGRRRQYWNAREGVSHCVRPLRCQAKACRACVHGPRDATAGGFTVEPQARLLHRPSERPSGHLLLLLWCDDAHRRPCLPPPVTICTIRTPPPPSAQLPRHSSASPP